MMAEFRDYVKTLEVADHYYIGKIENVKEKVLGIYSTPYMARVEAVGKASLYDVAGIRLLLHWNKNAKETEAAARSLYEKLRYIKNVEMGEIHVDYLDLNEAEPQFIGTDDNGVYEYVNTLNIYYRR